MAQIQILEQRGHQVSRFTRSSAGLERTPLGMIRAFFSGMYNPASRRAVARVLRAVKPGVAHIHNLFPWISPAILPVLRRAGVPVVMTVHNYRLVCPDGLHIPKGRHVVCERCCGGREYWCFLRNCEQSYFKSAGYALRTYTARRLGFFRKNITLFACLTEFHRKRLIAEGYPADRLRVIPNMYPADMETDTDYSTVGECVSYVGRISPEKGIELLLSAAEKLRTIPFRLAGNYNAMPALVDKAPANVSFLGNLDREQLAEFYYRSRVLVLCSKWFEGFPMVIVEAMAYAKPVIAPRIGGIPEIVNDGETGLLCTPGDIDELTQRIQYLWERPNLCRQMGEAARAKAAREYSPERYYQRLFELYREAVGFTGRI